MLFKEPVVQTRAGAQTLRGSEKQVAMSGPPPAQAMGGCQRLNSVVPGRDCIVYGRREKLLTGDTKGNRRVSVSQRKQNRMPTGLLLPKMESCSQRLSQQARRLLLIILAFFLNSDQR